jgi:hypothetical protein
VEKVRHRYTSAELTRNTGLSFTENLSTAASSSRTYESAEVSRDSCGAQDSDNKTAQYLDQITEPMGSLQSGNFIEIILLTQGKTKNYYYQVRYAEM